MKSIVRTSAVLLFLFLAGCASNPAVQNIGKNQVLPIPASAAMAEAADGDTGYRLGAQDLLQVSVFGVPELSREVRVGSNGKISLPLVGTVQAAGKTIPELEKKLADKLGKTYLQDPQVSVFVKEYTSQRITLEGALNKPGIYPLTGRTTLLQAVAMAGGMDELARRDGVVVFREVQGKRMAAVFDMTKITSGQEQDPRVFGDDIIVVARSGSKGALSKLIKSAPLLTLFFLVL